MSTIQGPVPDARTLTDVQSRAHNETARSEPPRPRKELRPRLAISAIGELVVFFLSGADADVRKRMPHDRDSGPVRSLPAQPRTTTQACEGSGPRRPRARFRGLISAAHVDG